MSRKKSGVAARLIYYVDEEMKKPVSPRNLFAEDVDAGKTLSKTIWVRNEGDADLYDIAIRDKTKGLKIRGFPKNLAIAQAASFKIEFLVPRDADKDFVPEFTIYAKYYITKMNL